MECKRDDELLYIFVKSAEVETDFVITGGHLSTWKAVALLYSRTMTFARMGRLWYFKACYLSPRPCILKVFAACPCIDLIRSRRPDGTVSCTTQYYNNILQWQ